MFGGKKPRTIPIKATVKAENHHVQETHVQEEDLFATDAACWRYLLSYPDAQLRSVMPQGSSMPCRPEQAPAQPSAC